MADAPAALGEQFEELPQQRDAAKLGMWTFIATEVLFFGDLFMGYIVNRLAYPQAFALASHHTVVLFGTINTAILLTSGLTMALSIHAARADNLKLSGRFVLLTIALGLAFLAVKGLEYHEDLHEHLWPGSHFRPDLPAQAQIFWFLYWVMTGVHSVHVIAGVLVLCVIAWMIARGRFSAEYHTPLEMTGLYWAFVDVIWIYLYPLLYLIQRYAAK